MRFSLLLGLLFCVSSSASAAVEVYDFSSDQAYERYLTLTEELRCPKCQNQNIADSDAPIAQDLRAEVHRLIEDGQSNADIVNFMVDRYGDFVRYRPAFSLQTALLWGGPLVMLLVGGVLVYRLSRPQRESREPISDAELRAQAQALLKKSQQDPR